MRQRGLELERHAKKLRSLRPNAVVTADTPAAPNTDPVLARDVAEADSAATLVQHQSALRQSAENAPPSQPAGPGPAADSLTAQQVQSQPSTDCISGPEGAFLQASTDATGVHKPMPWSAHEEQGQGGTASQPERSAEPEPVQVTALASDAPVPGAVRRAPGAIQTAPEVMHVAQGALQISPGDAQAAPGMVVWGTVKGWPPWPAIVLTDEEMDVAGVLGKHGHILKGGIVSLVCQAMMCHTVNTDVHSNGINYTFLECSMSLILSLVCMYVAHRLLCTTNGKSA